MTQFARPVSDLSNTGWTTAPLWSKVDEVSPSDADFIDSSALTSENICELNLNAVTDPGLSTGHVLKVRCLHNGSTDTFTMNLKRASTGAVIASRDLTGAPSSFTQLNFPLTGAEADSIVDYADLSIEFDHNEGAGVSATVDVSWVVLEVPDLPTAFRGLPDKKPYYTKPYGAGGLRA